ncbi:MAG: hypothetical protein AAB966_03180, partial [Patescibacteria group bacterium]
MDVISASDDNDKWDVHVYDGGNGFYNLVKTMLDDANASSGILGDMFDIGKLDILSNDLLVIPFRIDEDNLDYARLSMDTLTIDHAADIINELIYSEPFNMPAKAFGIIIHDSGVISISIKRQPNKHLYRWLVDTLQNANIHNMDGNRLMNVISFFSGGS